MGQSVMGQHGRYRVTSRPFKHPDEIKTDWLALESRADCSYFQSWGWIGTWLVNVVSDLGPVLVQVFEDQQRIALGIFLDRQFQRRLLIRSSAMFLNEYPFDGRNMVIEYNGLLIDRSCEDVAGVHAALIDSILGGRNSLDEIFFGGVSETTVSALGKADSRSSSCRIAEVSGSWQVDLTGIESGVDGFLKQLSKNRRAQIRRSLRVYQEQGELHLSEAANVSEALDYFTELGSLHSQRWRRKGLQGSFANPQWLAFHQALITERFPAGEVQLIKVTVADRPIGCLYSFIWRKRVCVLQTGFSITDDKRCMPGYVAHVLAIAHNRQKGMEMYDFMHGDSTYKRVLSNRRESLFWVSVQKRRIRFMLENGLLAIYRTLKRRSKV